MTMQAKKCMDYFRMMYMTQKLFKYMSTAFSHFATTIDGFTNEIIIKNITNSQKYSNTPGLVSLSDIGLCYCNDTVNKPNEVASLSNEELDNRLLDHASKGKDKLIVDIISACMFQRKTINEMTVRSLFRAFSFAGKPDMVTVLQKYCSKVYPSLYTRNGEFLHYLAKAQCFKGNSERGLSILTHCYKKYDGLRSFYRVILRELIQDSVLNRSEASLVIFRKYVLEFSNEWNEHYPLVCFWHICWTSSWFSDQMLANELLESSDKLRDIIRDKSNEFSISALRDFNDDAVLRLLQSLLKYNMMKEYAKVLQILFTYKLKNRDIRGCAEIIRNCEVLGISLPSDQQGKYIKMLIYNNTSDDKPSTTKPTSKNFKLKF